MLAVTVLLAAACSSEEGDPLIWSRAAWRNAAATVSSEGANYIAMTRRSGERVVPAVDRQLPDGVVRASFSDDAGPWMHVVYEGDTGHEVAARGIDRKDSGPFAEVRPLGAGAVAFWFTGAYTSPVCWHWEEGSDGIDETRFAPETVQGALWGFAAVPGERTPLLLLLRDGVLRCHTRAGDTGAELRVPSFVGPAAKGSLDVEVVAAGSAGRWTLRLRMFERGGYRVAHVLLERTTEGWSFPELVFESAYGPREDPDARYAPIAGDVAGAVDEVPYEIRPGELRGRQMQAFRLAGPVSEWPSFGGPCVPVFHSEKRISRSLWSRDTTHVAGALSVVSLETLEERLRVPITVEYPDISVAGLGLVEDGAEGLVYWVCVDGELRVHRRE